MSTFFACFFCNLSCGPYNSSSAINPKEQQDKVVHDPVPEGEGTGYLSVAGLLAENNFISKWLQSDMVPDIKNRC